MISVDKIKEPAIDEVENPLNMPKRSNLSQHI